MCLQIKHALKFRKPRRDTVKVPYFHINNNTHQTLSSWNLFETVDDDVATPVPRVFFS